MQKADIFFNSRVTIRQTAIMIALVVTVSACDKSSSIQQGTRVEQVMQGEKPVLRIVSKDGQTLSRSFLVNDELVLIETDEDTDGAFETLVLFTSDGSMGVFKRSADGSVKPVSPEILAKYKQQHDTGIRFWEQFENNMPVRDSE